MTKYNIAFKGLALGLHEFTFETDKKFFEYFAGGIANEGNVSAKVTLEKESSLMVLWFYINGTVKVQCDRCLEYYNQAVQSENRVFVKYSEERSDDGDDVIFVNPNDSQINLGKLIYDFIILSIPIRHIHPNDEKGKSLCNPDMLKKLKKLSSPVQHQQVDARWDDLKKLLGNE